MIQKRRQVQQAENLIRVILPVPEAVFKMIPAVFQHIIVPVPYLPARAPAPSHVPRISLACPAAAEPTVMIRRFLFPSVVHPETQIICRKPPPARAVFYPVYPPVPVNYPVPPVPLPLFQRLRFAVRNLPGYPRMTARFARQQKARPRFKDSFAY
jgi:hypothetical protein